MLQTGEEEEVQQQTKPIHLVLKPKHNNANVFHNNSSNIALSHLFIPSSSTAALSPNIPEI